MRVEQIVERVSDLSEDATDGPWVHVPSPFRETIGHSIKTAGDEPEVVAFGGYDHASPNAAADAELIASYRAMAPALAKALEDMTKLAIGDHLPFSGESCGRVETCCQECSTDYVPVQYPCAKVMVIRGVLDREIRT